MIYSESPLDRSAREPLHRQIYERFRTAIEHGVIAPGDRVASARALASELGVARGTVEAAYALLAGEGYFTPRGQAGTIVSASLPHRRKGTHLPAAHAHPRLVSTQPEPTPLPFQLGIPALDAFPRKLWSRLAARRMRAMGPGDMMSEDPAGYAQLREAIAAYLLVSRGVA